MEEFNYKINDEIFNEIGEDCERQIKFESEIDFPDYSNIISNKDSI